MTNETIYKLDNISMELKIATERAEAMLEDLAENFFSLDPEKKSGIFILNEFDNNRIKTDIARHFIYEVNEAIKELQAIIDKADIKIDVNEKQESPSLKVKTTKVAFQYDDKGGAAHES